MHIGHINNLRTARQLGDYLVVGLSAGEFNWEKGKESVQDYDNRKAVLEFMRFVDLVIPEVSWDQKVFDIQIYKIDFVIMGDEWLVSLTFLKNVVRLIIYQELKVFVRLNFKRR